MSLAASINRPVLALGSIYTLLRLVELDGKSFAVVSDGSHEIHVSAAWVFPIA